MAGGFNLLLLQIGERLTQLRKEKGYTSHEAFAWDNDIPRVQYWRLENGRANFTLKTLLRILDIHGLTMSQFFAQIEFPKNVDDESQLRSDSKSA